MFFELWKISRKSQYWKPDWRKEIAYTKELLLALEERIAACGQTGKYKKLFMENEKTDEEERSGIFVQKDDKECAVFGHKTATSTFYGYKTHPGDDRRSSDVGVSVTHGGAPDGQEITRADRKGARKRDRS